MLPIAHPYVLLGGLLVCLGCYGAGYRHAAGNAEEEAERKSVAAERLRWQTIAVMQAESEKIDAQYQEEIQNAQKELSSLRADVRSGRVGLRIATSRCHAGSPAAPGGVDGPGSADVDPGIAEALVGIAGRGDDAIRKLTALQEWVKNVCVSR